MNGWTPDDVRSLSLDDYEVLIEEMKKEAERSKRKG